VKHSPERIPAVLDSLRVGILAVDAQGRVELQNSEASRILGISAVTALGRTVEKLLGAGHPATCLVDEVLKSGREKAQNACMLTSRGEERSLWVDMIASPVVDGDDGCVLTLHDRTIGQELEALVAQRASDQLFQHLAAGIAHEIRNPLSGISGAAQLLQQRLSDAALLRYPNLIIAEIDRIRRLLDDLAQLTRGRDLERKATNLHQVLDHILELQATATQPERLQIVREYDPSLPELWVDRDRITQIFLNLVRNAAHAAGKGGRVTVRTRIEALFQIAAEDGARHRMVRIDIEDSGPGIPEHDLPHIFTPFFTTKSDGSGSGLGLAIAQHWVVRHGGRIHALRAHAGGARMRVLLPVGRST